VTKGLSSLIARMAAAEVEQQGVKARYLEYGCKGVHPQFVLRLGKREWKALQDAVVVRAGQGTAA
jgi:hypothetical protein